MRPEKRCSNCLKVKPITEFYVKRATNGYQSRCKPCNMEISYCYNNRHRPDRIDRYMERKYRE